MVDTLNTIALVVGYVVLAVFAATMCWLGYWLFDGLRHSLDYHRWVVRNAKNVGTYESHVKGRWWAYVKSVFAHSFEYAGMVEGSQVQRTKHGWWQFRGNWVDSDGKRGPRFDANTSIMR